MKLIRISDIRHRISAIAAAVPEPLRKQWHTSILYAVLLPLADLLSAYWVYLIVMAIQHRPVTVAGITLYSGSSNNFSFLIAGFIAVCTLRQILSYVSISSARSFTQSIYKAYSTRLITVYLSMPWINFTGDTRAAKINHSMNTTLNAAFSFQIALTFISSLCTLILLGSATFIKVPILAVAALISLVIVSAIIKKNIGRRLKSTARQHELFEKLYHQKLHEVFNLPREINLFGVKEQFLDSLDDLLSKLSKAKTELSIYPQIPKIAIELVLTISLMGGIVLTLVSGTYSSAEMIANTATVALLARRIIPSMSDFLAAYTELYGSSMNVAILKKELEQDVHIPDLSLTDTLPGNSIIRLENISFAYSGKERILNHTNLDINQRDRIMLHGKTGKGKSTLLMIAAGIINPSDGKVFLNISTPKRSFAYVAQETTLMRGTVLDNIVFGNPVVDSARAAEALRLVNMDIFVNTLAGALKAEIGDNGVKFSGGQRQRLGIARALYSEPGILFLDEATSALDEETEMLVMRNICEYMQDSAVLFITHRTSVGEKFANKTCHLQ